MNIWQIFRKKESVSDIETESLSLEHWPKYFAKGKFAEWKALAFVCWAKHFAKDIFAEWKALGFVRWANISRKHICRMESLVLCVVCKTFRKKKHICRMEALVFVRWAKHFTKTYLRYEKPSPLRVGQNISQK